MNWIECIILFAVALGVTIALTPLARRLAIALDAIDYPSARRVNMQPIPRMGGVAIFGGMVAALALALVGAHFWGWTTPLQGGLGNKVNWIGVAVGILIMFGVGIVDDILQSETEGQVARSRSLLLASWPFQDCSSRAFTISSATATLSLGGYRIPLPSSIWSPSRTSSTLIDGLDGLAAGITAITAATIGILAVLTWRPGAALASFVIVGACIGFLKSNIHPASIFMGDSGALLLGFALGIVSLMAVARSAFFVSLLVPIIAAGVPILDTAIAIIRRKRAHQPIDSADRGHIHHRLLQAGYSQKATVYIMWGWTALLSAGAIVVSAIDGPPRYVVFVILAVVAGFIVFKLKLLQPVLLHHYNPRSKTRRGTTADQDSSERSAAHTNARNDLADGRNGATHDSGARRGGADHPHQSGHARRSTNQQVHKR